MKVIAFKIYGRQKVLIRSMVEKGFYPSFSEAVRTACWDLLEDLMQAKETEPVNKSEAPEAKIKLQSDKFNELNSSLISKKVATSAKFPIKVLKKIDDYVMHEQFNNRSEFIRHACSAFLMTDSEIFSSFMENRSAAK